MFAVTASFSLFAYIWLLVILKWSSPGVVTMLEAVLTFAFFPILVVVAYAADKRWFHLLLCKGRGGGQVLLSYFPYSYSKKSKFNFSQGRFGRQAEADRAGELHPR